MRFCILYGVILILRILGLCFFLFQMAVIVLVSCSEIEEAQPSEEVVESEETPEGVETGENRSFSHKCREYLVSRSEFDLLNL